MDDKCKRICKSYERKETASALLDVKSPTADRGNIFKISRNHEEVFPLKGSTSVRRLASRNTENEGFLSMPRIRYTSNFPSPQSRSLVNLKNSRIASIPLISNKKGSIPQTEVNAVNKKLRELQQDIYMKERQLLECKQELELLQDQLKKQTQNR